MLVCSLLKRLTERVVGTHYLVINRTGCGYSLLSRVVELVLVGASEALLNACVAPESLHGREQLLREGFSVLHPGDHVKHHLGVRLRKDGDKHIIIYLLREKR